MKKNYPVVTLCGSTKFKEEFERVQKKLTLQGYIVISVGLFGHSGDDEVWDGMDKGTVTQTKMMLDDMHKAKIDLADEIFVINPNGYIGDSTWSEICYTRMTDKHIDSLNHIAEAEIDGRVQQHIEKAEELAFRQYDYYSHMASDVPTDMLLKDMALIRKNRFTTMDPWVPENQNIKTADFPYIGHADKTAGYDPFVVFGKKKMARFTEEIIMREKAGCEGVIG